MWHEMVNYTSDSYLRYSIYYFCKGNKNQKLTSIPVQMRAKLKTCRDDYTRYITRQTFSPKFLDL